jgi:hypothetical protein
VTCCGGVQMMRSASEFTDSRSGPWSRTGTWPPAEMTSVRSELASRRARQLFPPAAAAAMVDACVAQARASVRGRRRSEGLVPAEPAQPATTRTTSTNAGIVLNTLPLCPNLLEPSLAVTPENR